MSFTKIEMKKMMLASLHYYIDTSDGDSENKMKAFAFLDENSLSAEYTVGELWEIVEEAFANPVDKKEMLRQSVGKRPIFDAFEAREGRFSDEDGNK